MATKISEPTVEENGATAKAKAEAKAKAKVKAKPRAKPTTKLKGQAEASEASGSQFHWLQVDFATSTVTSRPHPEPAKVPSWLQPLPTASQHVVAAGSSVAWLDPPGCEESFLTNIQEADPACESSVHGPALSPAWLNPGEDEDNPVCRVQRPPSSSMPWLSPPASDSEDHPGLQSLWLRPSLD